jgi:predicted amidohydrolase YtcJ
VEAGGKSPRDQGTSEAPGEKRGLSRKQFVVGGAAAGAAIGLGGTGAALAAGKAPATPKNNPDREFDAIAFINGRIHTMDPQNRVVSQIVIRDGVIAEVGDSVPKGTKTKVINLKGRVVTPGIVEPHIHIVSLANRPGYHTPTENARSIAEVQALLAARRPGVPAGQWITSMGGFNRRMFAEQRFPTLTELDAAVPDRPVFMYEGFTGPAQTNSLGKAFFETASAPLAGPVTVGADGSITNGTQAQRALYHLRVLQTWEDRLRSTDDAMAYAVSQGLTSALDQVLFPVVGPPTPNQVLSNLDGYRMYDPWLERQREDKTIMRLTTNFLHNQGFISDLGPNLPADLPKQLPELRERLRNQFQYFGSDMMRTGGIGEWAAPISATGNGFLVWQEAQRLCAEARWHNENAVGSLAQFEQCIVAYEAMDAQYGIKDLRWMVHHVPAVNTNQLDRLKALGGGVVMRGFQWIAGNPGPTPAGSPFRLIVDHGIKAALEGDGVHISTLNPWPHMHYAITGLNALGQQINPGQQITRQEALRAFTTEAAWFSFMENKIGSLEAGKLGDLIVLNQDYFTVPEADIYKTRSVLTVVDGNIVHDEGLLKT